MLNVGQLAQDIAGIQLQPVLGAPAIPEPPALEGADPDPLAGRRQAQERGGVGAGRGELGQQLAVRHPRPTRRWSGRMPSD
jgi:hypothetical protein